MWKIKNKYSVLILVPTLLLYGTALVCGMGFVNRSFREQAVTQKSNELEYISNAVNGWLVSRITDVLQLSRMPLVAEGPSDGAMDYLTRWRRWYSHIYENVYYLSPQGDFRDARGGTGRLDARRMAAFFTGPERHFFFIGPDAQEPHFASSLVVAAPVHDGEALQGIIAGTIPLGTFEKMLGVFSFKEFDSFMLTDSQAVIISHSDPSLAGRKESEVYGTEFSAVAPHGEHQVFVSVLRTNWKLVGFIKEEVLLRTIKDVNRLVFSASFLVALVLAFSSYAMISLMVRPIRLLTTGVKRIMEGDYRQRLHLTSGDEVQELSDAFNRLSARMVEMRRDDRFLFLGHISARMAHEMRKPLHIIKLTAQAMEEKKEYNRGYLAMMRSEVNNADYFIGQILNFTRDERLDLIKYAPGKLLEKVVRKFRLIADESGVRIDYKEEGEAAPFFLDPLKMEEVFSNLFQNALEAVEGCGEAEKRITVRLCAREPHKTVLTITDSGPGIPEELIDRCFDPYYTTKDEGSGLGLSICHRILTAHGARIILENSEDRHGRVRVVFSH